jgi:hypothetical protein
LLASLLEEGPLELLVGVLGFTGLQVELFEDEGAILAVFFLFEYLRV